MRSRRRLAPPLALIAVVAAIALAAACGSKDNGGAIQTQSEKAVTSTTAPPSDAYGYPAPSDSSASTSTTAATAGASGDTITAKGFSFATGATVKAGATVHVDNQDSTTHTVSADDGSSFDTSVDGGTKATFTAPSKPGTYPFHCKIHPSMHGTLTVQ